MSNGGNNKNPVLAAIFSFFIPGLGQVYNGEGFLKGFLYMIGTVVGYVILIIPGFIVWLYGIFNAYSVAKKINSGIVPYKHVGAGSLIIYAVLSFVITFVGIVIVTLVVFTAIFAFVFALGGGSGY